MLDEHDRTKSGLKAAGFDWSDVKMGVDTGLGIKEDQGENPVDFMVALGIRILNDEGRECPYKIDADVAALIRVSEALPPERREELAEVNGLAIAYGAMREMIVGVTSRMEYGALVLPGVNFQDHARSERASPQQLK